MSKITYKMTGYYYLATSNLAIGFILACGAKFASDKCWDKVGCDTRPGRFASIAQGGPTRTDAKFCLFV